MVGFGNSRFFLGEIARPIMRLGRVEGEVSKGWNRWTLVLSLVTNEQPPPTVTGYSSAKTGSQVMGRF